MPDEVKGIVEKHLVNAYREMALKLSRLVGYRVSFTPSAQRSAARFLYSEDGHLQYSILRTTNVQLGIVELDGEARHDEFATKTTHQFVSRARKLFDACKHTRDVKDTLLRNEASFWDDLILGYTYPNNNHYELLRTLWTLRSALHFRYEGAMPKVGALMTWNLDTLAERANSSSIVLRDEPQLDQLLKESKAAYLLSDGEASIYVVHGRRAIQLLYRSSNITGVSQDEGWEFVPSEYRWLRRAIKGRDVAIINTNVGEQTLVTSKAVLRWAGGQWTRITHSQAVELFPEGYPKALRQIILDTAGRLSHMHVGALIILPQDAEKLGEISAIGLSHRLSGKRFLRLSDQTQALFERLCSIDGATIVEQDGFVVDAGVLIKLNSTSGEGARSAAAATASRFGLAIKVSHDGPITFFQRGERVASVG